MNLSDKNAGEGVCVKNHFQEFTLLFCVSENVNQKFTQRCKGVAKYPALWKLTCRGEVKSEEGMLSSLRNRSLWKSNLLTRSLALNSYQPIPGLKVLSYNGTRILDMCSPSTGNLLTSELVTCLHKKVSNLHDNVAVGAIFIQVYSDSVVFCNGISKEDFELDPRGYMEHVNKFADLISNFKKSIMISYAGKTNGTGFGG